MDVTIIGAGNMGRGIGTRLVAGGNHVKILDRDPDQASELANELSQTARTEGAAEGGAAGDPLSGEVGAPSGARLVKAFNTTFAATLVEGQVGGHQLDVMIAGDDDQAKETVAELARAGGLNAIDVGPLKRARELERLGFLHMAIQDALGTGYGSAVKVVT